MNTNVDKVVLDLCSGTGSWSLPYKDAGYTVHQVDLPTDVRLYNKPRNPIHGILAAPPCTVFASSGARWKRSGQEYLDGISIVDACLRLVVICKPVWWALENPVGRLSTLLGKPRMYFHPWEYGDPWTKKTCLWGSFNIPTKTPVTPSEGGKIWRMPPSPSRTRDRSRTPMGFARAFFLANL